MAYAIRISATLTVLKCKNCSWCFLCLSKLRAAGLRQGDTIFVASQYMALNGRFAPYILTDFERLYMHGKRGRSRNAACDVCLN